MFDVENGLQIELISSYFRHLHHVRKLCQTGNRDHIVVGFQLVPGGVRTHIRTF